MCLIKSTWTFTHRQETGNSESLALFLWKIIETDTMSKKIGEYSEDHLLGVAKGVVEKKTTNSKLLDAEAEARIPKFHPSGNDYWTDRAIGRFYGV